MIKWRLLATTLPLVVLVVGIALVRDYVLHAQGVLEFGEVAPILGAASLIIGFMLAGVLADFKESERIPAEIATTLETIGDTVKVISAVNKAVDAGAYDRGFRTLAFTVEDWFMGRLGVEKCYDALNDFRSVITGMEQAGGVGYAIRCLSETHNLRRLITRVDVITRTSFIPVGYALLDLLVGATLVLLLATTYKSTLAEYFLITLFSLVYIYMTRLIYDLDAPFAYSSKKGRGGSAEVNPYPLQEYRLRLEANRPGQAASGAP
jgi:hypothetical protein